MQLARSFFKLPLRIDIERLRAEVGAVAPEAWTAHPNLIAGNSSVRLISCGGQQNDAAHGPMAPTAALAHMPYVRQLLADFGVVWSRSRLMRLAAGAQVPAHADINLHWFNRVRIHIPVFTTPQVRFFCGDEVVHMAAGEVWLFDNWRMHRVENASDADRTHLVADTSGSASFWNFVAEALNPQAAVRQHSFDPSRDVQVRTERLAPAVALHPAEIELVVRELCREIVPARDDDAGRASAVRLGSALEEFSHDWRQVYALYGADAAGWPHLLSLREALRSAAQAGGPSVLSRSNGIDMQTIIDARLLRHVLMLPAGQDPQRTGAATRDEQPI